jgi:type IV pilus assembly protein PilA
MRTELKAKFIQHLNRKQSEKGFTLVELLVVIIIIGILAAIALPNFLNQGTEAKQNIGMSNRVQTVYRSENASFASTFNKLAMGVLSDDAADSGHATTTNYEYQLLANAATPDNTQLLAGSRDSALKAYVGGSNLYVNTESKNVIASVICEGVTPAAAASPVSTVNLTDLSFSTTTDPTCPAGQVTLGK